MDDKRKEKKQLVIVNAAVDLFYAKGYHNTKMEEIAKKAKIAKGTVYLYFKHKSDIFNRIFADHKNGLFSLAGWLESRGEMPAEKKIEWMINETFNFFEKNYKVIVIIRSIISGTASGFNKNLYNEIAVLYRRLNESVTKIINQGVKEKAFRNIKAKKHISVFIVAVLEGMFFQWIVFPDSFDSASVKKAALEILFKGLKK